MVSDDSDDSDDSNFNSYHPVERGGGGGGRRPRTSRFGRSGDPALGPGSGPACKQHRSRQTVLIGRIPCHFDSDPMPCRLFDSRILAATNPGAGGACEHI
jgi:hypothetical protein